MKRTFMLLVILCLVPSMAAPSHAQDSQFIGIGIMIGEPTGFNAKVWWDDTWAFDGGLAWSFSGETEVSLHGDLLFHNWNILRDALEITGRAELPLYYGIGGRIKAGDDNVAGVRFPVGVSLMIEEVPFDMFFEIAPIMDIAPETKLRGHGALGLRFWF